MFGIKISSESKLFGGGPPCPRTTSATLVDVNINVDVVVDVDVDVNIDVDVDICQLEGSFCSNGGGPKLSASSRQEDGRAHLLAGLPPFLHPIQSFAGLDWSKSNLTKP